MMTASTQTRINFLHGPAKRPEWARMIRLGGDRVAVLFEELRKSVRKVDGIVERLHYSGREAGWLVQYGVGGVELLTTRISPGLLEVDIPLSPSDSESLLRMRSLSATIKDAIHASASQVASNSIRLPVTNRRGVHSVASLVMAKSRLVAKAARPVH